MWPVNETPPGEARGNDHRIEISAATRADVALVLELVRELAHFERLESEVTATHALMENALFGDPPCAFCAIARVDGNSAGFALYFRNFSTFLAKPGIYLEDLFVRPKFRGRGIGTALLEHLARIAVAQGAGRFEWTALDWNRPARDFYENLGARPMPEWIIHRLSGAALERVAQGKTCT